MADEVLGRGRQGQEDGVGDLEQGLEERGRHDVEDDRHGAGSLGDLEVDQVDLERQDEHHHGLRDAGRHDPVGGRVPLARGQVEVRQPDGQVGHGHDADTRCNQGERTDANLGEDQKYKDEQVANARKLVVLFLNLKINWH